jgi:hypothetical protein
MSALEALKKFSQEIKNIQVSESDTAKLTRLTDADVLSTEEIATMQSLCKTLGVRYSGKSFNIYTKRTGEYEVSLPRIYSNGQHVVFSIGGEELPLDPKAKVFKGCRFRNGSKGAFLLYRAHDNFEVPLFLKPDSTVDKTVSYDKAINAFDEEAHTWSDVLPLLFGVYPKMSQDEAKLGFKLTEAEEIKVKTEEGETRSYWKTSVMLGSGVHRMAFLPHVEGVAFSRGDVISFDNGTFKHERTGKTFSMGTCFVKLADLPSGDYVVVKVADSKGEFPGVNFTLSDGRIVSGNAKMKSWATSLRDYAEVSSASPATLTVGNKNVLRNGKTQIIVFIRFASQAIGGVDALLKRSSAATSDLELPDLLGRSNGVDEPSVMALSSKATALLEPAEQPLSPQKPATLIEDGDQAEYNPWDDILH